MTLTTGGKDWIATYCGVNGCFTNDNVITITSPDDGSTRNVNTYYAFVAVCLCGEKQSTRDFPVVAGKSYLDFLAANGGNEVSTTGADTDWVYDHVDGGYCVSGGGGGTEPSAAGEPALAGTFTVSTPGPVSGIMDISNANLRWNNSKGKLDIDDISVTNTSTDAAYFAIFARIWTAPRSTCPTTGTPSWKGPDLTSVNRNIATTRLDAGETDEINYDGYVGAGTLAPGSYVACVELWANYSNSALKDELAVA